MTSNIQRLGDRGQRYEVRYTEKGGGVKKSKFGWCQTRAAAEKMVASWSQNPIVERCWFVDRRPNDGPDPFDPADLAVILQDRLQSVLVGKPVNDALLVEMNQIIDKFCKDFVGFPKVVAVLVGPAHIEIFNEFEKWSDVDGACRMAKMKYPGNDEFINNSFKPHFDRFPLAEFVTHNL